MLIRRRISGKQYVLRFLETRKTRAEGLAKVERKRGFNVRVTKEKSLGKNLYPVWVRKR